MNTKIFVAFLVTFSVWTSLFAPFITAQNTSQGLQYRITESKKKLEKIKIKPNLSTENLSEKEANEIFSRLPPMSVEKEETSAFNIHPDNIKPPKSGTVTQIKLDEQESKKPQKISSQNSQKLSKINKQSLEALKIERFSPEGETEIVSQLSITFSQPMIDISTQTEASENVPVKLSPEVKGRWRWLGTTTLVFEAETRFPMATKFTATIPKNTKSVVDGKLKQDFIWTFSTPPPQFADYYPKSVYGGVFPPKTIFVKFDQEIDEQKIFPKISVIADEKSYPIELVTSKIISENGEGYTFNGAKPKHWLAIQMLENLPQNTLVKVMFEKGLSSAEGNLKSDFEQGFSFKTLENFKLNEALCGYVRATERQCQPSDNFELRFSRSLSTDKLDISLIKIEPPIENAIIEKDGSGTQIHIKGRKKQNTTYKVTLSGEALDFYKQKIGQDISTTFNVGIEQQRFFAQGGTFITLDPDAQKKFSIYTKNHPNFKVRIYSVKPEDFQSYSNFMSEYEHTNSRRIIPPVNFGKLVFDKTIELKNEVDILTETRIRLDEAIPDKFGHAFIVAESNIKPQDYNNWYYNQPIIAWIQSTNIGIDTVTDYEKIVFFLNDLQTAKPIQNAEISIFHDYNNKKNVQLFTDENGLAKFEKPELEGFLSIIKNGDDSVLFSTRFDWRTYWKNGSNRWFMFDDRKIYRPNEEVSIKGYIRKITGGKFTDIDENGNRVKSVRYILRDPRNNKIADGIAELNAFGAFDFKIKLPENINLGYQRLSFWSNDNSISYSSEFEHSFQVEEFRRPEFEVSIEAETPTPYLVGNSVTIEAKAEYYTGGALPNSSINWDFCASQTTYSPPNHQDFVFGTFIAWWKHDTFLPNRNICRQNTFVLQNQSETENQINKNWQTDVNGKHLINIDFFSANPSRPYNLQTTAQVTDVNRQVISETKNFLVHPSEIYIGLRTAKTFIRQNEPLKVDAIATDIDGNLVSDAPIKIEAVLKKWECFAGSSREVVIDTQTCEVKSAKETVSCNFTAKQGGNFHITATVLDEKERSNTSDITIWVAGGKVPPNRKIDEEIVELIPDKREYSPNDTAEILVNSPYETAEGIMTLERNGIITTERFRVNDSSKILQIPIEERYLPNFHVKVDLISTTERLNNKGEVDYTLPKRPAYASGTINLDVSKASRKLSVSVEPTEKITEPGKETKINVEVKDNTGNAVANSEIALIAVDESVLALTDYKIQNPLDAFYQKIQPNVAHYHSRKQIVLANTEDIVTDEQVSNKMIESLSVNARQISSLILTDGAKTDSNRVKKIDSKSPYQSWTEKDVAYIITPEEKAKFNESQIKIRQNFDALAIFSPSVLTDQNGKATVDLKLPDNLTRYRITAVAVTKSKQFGFGESNITAKQSLQVRPSAPRFLNYGDKADLPVVLQNQTDKPLSVNVAIRGSNAHLSENNGKKVEVPANDRVEISFPVNTVKAGFARFQIGAVAENFADAAEIEIPVYTPSTTETFATYSTTEAEGAIIQTISPPKDVFADFGGLQVTTSSTQLQELTDAFIYLQNYPFECSEQISSRVLSVAALRDVLTAFNAKDMPNKEAIEAKMRQDIARLQQLQHYNGGFSFWRTDDQSIPYLSVHVAHAIARAKQKNYKIPSEMISKSLIYLSNIEEKLPKEYSAESRWAISAYALYVRDLFSEKDVAKTKKLLTTVGLEKLSAESIGWILSVLAGDKNSVTEVETIKRHLLNRVSETSGKAYFITKYTDGEYVLLSSQKRADAVILEALLKVEPDNILIPKIVRGLLAEKIKGRWQSTQENAFVLLALDKYFQTYEKVTPNFVAKIWLGNSYLGEQKFQGHSTNSNLISVPMQYLQTNNTKQNLVFDKKGEGRLYYRIAMNYSPKNLNLAAADYGFDIKRTYEPLDNPDDVRLNSDRSWTIKTGSRVRINVQIVATSVRYHVALVDYLPAGLEIINRNLATTSRLDYDYSYYYQQRFWAEHQNLRDNRAEAFSTIVRNGIWNYSYTARATTKGNFIAPPAKAEEMYSPETFGRSKTDFVKVE